MRDLKERRREAYLVLDALRRHSLIGDSCGRRSQVAGASVRHAPPLLICLVVAQDTFTLL